MPFGVFERQLGLIKLNASVGVVLIANVPLCRRRESIAAPKKRDANGGAH